MKQNYRFTFFLICCLFLSTCAIILAQTTDKELQFQSSLIDALKEEKIGNPEKAIAILEKLQSTNASEPMDLINGIGFIKSIYWKNWADMIKWPKLMKN